MLSQHVPEFHSITIESLFTSDPITLICKEKIVSTCIFYLSYVLDNVEISNRFLH